MLNKIKEWMLERHVRDLMKKYYATFGLTIEQVEKMSIGELLEKVNGLLENLDKESSYYARMCNHYENKITNITVENKDLKARYKELETKYNKSEYENAKLMEEKFNLKLENKLLKELGVEKDISNTKQKSIEIAR